MQHTKQNPLTFCQILTIVISCVNALNSGSLSIGVWNGDFRITFEKSMVCSTMGNSPLALFAVFF